MKDIIVKIKPKVALFWRAPMTSAWWLPGNSIRIISKKIPYRGLLASGWVGLINHSQILSYAVNFFRYRQAHTMGLIGPVLDFPHLKQVEISPEKSRRRLGSKRST